MKYEELLFRIFMTIFTFIILPLIVAMMVFLLYTLAKESQDTLCANNYFESLQ